MIFDKPLRVDAYELDNTEQRLLVRVIQSNKNFMNVNVGDLLIARGKDKRVYYSTKAFYLYHLETAKPFGCFKVSNFEILGQFDTLEQLQHYLQQDLQQVGTTTIQQVEKTFVEETEADNEYGQLSLFDF